MSLRPAVALALAAFLAHSGCAGRSDAGRPSPGPVPKVGAAARSGRLVLSGELTAARAAALAVPETPAWMVALRFLEEDGTPVKKGQRVAEFDSSVFSSTLEEKRIAKIEAEAERLRAAAEAQVTEADRLLALEQKRVAHEKALLEASIPADLRPRREHEEKQMARERAAVERKKAEADRDAAREAAAAEDAIRALALSRAAAELARAEQSLASLTLLAPEDGVLVVGDNPRERRKIQTGDMLWPSVVVARVSQASGLQAEAFLHDVDDGRLAAGAEAVVIPDAFPDRRIPARVTEVAAVAQQISNESPRRAFRVQLKLAEGSLEGLRPGLSVKVEIGPPAAPAPAAAAAAELPKAGSDTVRVRKETFVSSVELKGALRALDSEPLGPPQIPQMWEFRITMMAPEGSTVKKGQPVLAFDPTTLVQRLQEKQAEADSAAKQIEKRERDLALRREEIAQRRVETEARKKKAELKVDIPAELARALELAQARLDLALATREMELLAAKAAAAERAAKAELSSLTAKRDAARLRVKEIAESIPLMSIKAPRDGIVVYIPNWRDEKKKVGDVCWRSEKALDVPDITRLGVAAEVDEADSGRVTLKQRVTIRLESDPDREHTGFVSQIRRNIQRLSPKNPLKVARLEVTLDKVDPRMRPGMRVKGRVEIERVVGALVIPAECLVASAEGPVAFRRSGGGVKPVPVRPGRRSDGKVEVLSGLSEGDELAPPESGS